MEDDLQLRTVVAAVLSLEGYELIEAANGADALALLREGRAPDLILLDLMMPVMNGLELLEELEKLPGLDSVPSLVLSAFAEGMAPPPGIEYLRKPVELDDLLHAVRKLGGLAR